MAITPDTKDRTWVLERSCVECGFDPASVDRFSVADRIARSAGGWNEVLARADACIRPDASTWSALEYGCHVRDVHTIMRERLALMLKYDESASEGAEFDNWDQDSSAIEGRYRDQDPPTVARELTDAAVRFADAYRRVNDGQWVRRGLRSNGSVFTVQSFASYALHDLEHHRVDVGLAPR